MLLRRFHKRTKPAMNSERKSAPGSKRTSKRPQSSKSCSKEMSTDKRKCSEFRVYSQPRTGKYMCVVLLHNNVHRQEKIQTGEVTSEQRHGQIWKVQTSNFSDEPASDEIQSLLCIEPCIELIELINIISTHALQTNKHAHALNKTQTRKYAKQQTDDTKAVSQSIPARLITSKNPLLE